ncbi:MAG TPA: apolipoprotein N-acyltransferase, partial [Mycobacterium sp.]|nr:apolipoprotein N-acyltransferase [Mycobacterium sp.]
MAKSNRRRDWGRATDDTDIFPPIVDDDDVDSVDDEDAPEPAASDKSARIPAWARRFGQAVVDRLAQLGVTIVAGVALCVSFPPFVWWFMAIAAFGLMAWVLTRESTTLAGGFGYGFLFGLVFYLPLLPWIGGFVGAIPWIALCIVQALFPALFGLAAVAVRRLSGWPFWFAALWAAQEWLKSSVPFGGFPWGVVGFSQTDGPLLSIAQLGGAPLLSFAVVLTGFSLAAITFEIVKWWRHDDNQTAAPPAVVLPGVCISAVLLTTALAWPHVRQAGLGAGDDPAITVAAVQGNVPRLGLEFNAQRRAVLDNHVRQTIQLADDVHAGRAPQPMVVIWPENSSDIDPLVN